MQAQIVTPDTRLDQGLLAAEVKIIAYPFSQVREKILMEGTLPQLELRLG